MLSYKKVFDPKKTENFKPSSKSESSAEKDTYAGDRRDGLVYVYDDDIVLAVNVALTTKRPLLIRGPSGSGKSSLARNVARFFKWRYYEEVISSRTQARDLQWQFDTLRRLSDAQAQTGVKPDPHYVEPGVLWWAFDRDSALRRGVSEEYLPKVVAAGEMSSFQPVDPNKGDDHVRAVVLIDEIDKADPDTPNNLLVALGSLEFFATEANALVKAVEPPLVIITSNDERELSTAFLRRCIMLNLVAPDRQRLIEIARAHFGKQKLRLYREVAELMIPEEKTAETTVGDARTQQSAAEFLDTVHACIKLKVTPNQEDDTWRALSKATLWKPRETAGVM
jgi:MoxR-like ATPase